MTTACKLLALLPIAVMLTGCAAPVPVAENFPVSYQKVARTAQHWNVVADDVVAQTSGALQSHPTLKGRPVFIRSGHRSTAFDAAFQSFLTNHMVNRGLPVNVCKSVQTGAGGFASEATEVEVQYDFQLVQHSARMPYYRPGDLVALAAGVVVARSLAVSHFDGTEASIIGLGLAALVDAEAGTVARPTKTEIIITTTIAENNRYLFRRSDIYYVPEQDAHLFLIQGAYPPSCPSSARSAALTNAAELEQSRLDLFNSSMRRRNPHWQ